MSITIKSTLGLPAGGNGRRLWLHSLIRSRPQSDAASKNTTLATAGKLSLTSRPKPTARRSSAGTNRIAIPRASTSPAGPKIRGEAAQSGGSKVNPHNSRGASQLPRFPHHKRGASTTPSATKIARSVTGISHTK